MRITMFDLVTPDQLQKEIDYFLSKPDAEKPPASLVMAARQLLEIAPFYEQLEARVEELQNSYSAKFQQHEFTVQKIAELQAQGKQETVATVRKTSKVGPKKFAIILADSYFPVDGDKLYAHPAQDTKDAARYRWLRDVAPTSVRKKIVNTSKDEEMDSVIDASIENSKT